MSSEIASYKETVLQIDTLEALQEFLKEHKIAENSNTGQLLAGFQRKIVNKLLTDDRIQSISK